MRADMWCWKCGALAPVVGLAVFDLTDEEDGVNYGNAASRPPDAVGLTYVADLPYDLLDCVRAFQPRYSKRESRTGGETYYQNECHSCSVNIGDFYLFSEPDAPFFLDSDNATVELFRLPIIEPVRMNARYSRGGALDTIFSSGIPTLRTGG